jgi:hypothetical protein
LEYHRGDAVDRVEVSEGRQVLAEPHTAAQVPEVVHGVSMYYQLGRKDAKVAPEVS